MQNRFVVNLGSTLILAFASLIMVSGCASTTAPGHWLLSASDTEHEAHGGWVRIRLLHEPLHSEIAGELIAINEMRVIVLDSGTVRYAPMDSIFSLDLDGYRSQAGGLAAWTALGTLSTLSHGIALIFSAPVWIISGSISAAAQSNVPRLTLNQHTWYDQWRELAAYARFPADVPKTLDLSSLKQKTLR